MATFREAREALLLAHDNGAIDDQELLFLFDINTSKNLDLPFWSYERCDLDALSDDECKSEFRFKKHDIYALCEVLNLPEKVSCANRFCVDDMETLCILLKRFAYLCRYEDMIPRFGRATPQLSMVVNKTMDIIHDQYGYLLRSFNQAWLALSWTYSTSGSFQQVHEWSSSCSGMGFWGYFKLFCFSRL